MPLDVHHWRTFYRLTTTKAQVRGGANVCPRGDLNRMTDHGATDFRPNLPRLICLVAPSGEASGEGPCTTVVHQIGRRGDLSGAPRGSPTRSVRPQSVKDSGPIP